MKKFVISLVIISIIFFSVGLSVGVFKFFPYYQLDHLKGLILSETQSDTKYVMNNFVYDENIDSLIRISSIEDIQNKKLALLQYLWNQNHLPDHLPINTQTKIDDPSFNNLQNLKQIDLIEYEMEFGINSISYIFHPETSNDKVIIYHQGHGGNFVKGKSTIEYFLKEGFTVHAFSMPLLGMNDRPIIDTDYGTIILNTHDHLKYLETKNFSPLKLFFEPIVVSLNYLDENYSFNEYHMIGISGGAWTSMYYSAIDDRISNTYPVAGPYPLFLRSNYNQLGDYETEHPELLSHVNELEAYVMGAYGKDRKFVQIYNKYDSCCWDGEYFEIFEDTIKNKISTLGEGYYDVELDDTHRKHIISEHALNLIKNSLDED